MTDYEKFFGDDWEMITAEQVEKGAAEIAENMRRAKQEELDLILVDLKRRGFELPYHITVD